MIDVLPYNGDESTDNPRNNAFDPSSSTASKYHDGSPKKSAGLAAIPVTPSGTSLEYVVYSPNNPASYPQNIKQDPCAVSNLPAGFDPLTDPAHYCYLLRYDGGSNAGQLIGGSTTGTGATPWTATAPTDLNDVVAFRVLTQPLAVGTAPQTISYSIRPTDNRGGDVYCNNFSSRVPEISLEVRSNTVCARVAGGQLADTGINENYYILAAIAMLVGGSALMVGARFRN